MPRYYVDIDDGLTLTRDDEGLELDIEAAKAEAIGVLPDIARDELPDGDQREFVVSVRDKSGRTMLRATLSLVVEHIS